MATVVSWSHENAIDGNEKSQKICIIKNKWKHAEKGDA